VTPSLPDVFGATDVGGASSILPEVASPLMMYFVSTTTVWLWWAGYIDFFLFSFDNNHAQFAPLLSQLFSCSPPPGKFCVLLARFFNNRQGAVTLC